MSLQMCTPMNHVSTALPSAAAVIDTPGGISQAHKQHAHPSDRLKTSNLELSRGKRSNHCQENKWDAEFMASSPR